MTSRGIGLAAAGSALDAVAAQPPQAVLPVSAKAWNEGRRGPEVVESLSALDRSRQRAALLTTAAGADLGKRLRPALIEHARKTAEACRTLDLLLALDSGDERVRGPVLELRTELLQDARAVVDAAATGAAVGGSSPSWPVLPVASGSPRDELLEMFGVPTSEVQDASGAFSDARVLAAYRLRLPDLKRRCDPVMRLVAQRPPSVFLAVDRVRDLVTSASPLTTLLTAQDVRTIVLAAFSASPDLAAEALADSWHERDRLRLSVDRLRASLRRARVAATAGDRSVALLEAYKHAVEGLTKRWVWTLLRMQGMDGDPPTVGELPQKLTRLGAIGERMAPALVAAARNAEAHEDFEYDDDAGTLMVGGSTVTDAQLDQWLERLDVMQRGWELGRLSAISDRPALQEAALGRLTKGSRSYASDFARQRFGHAGMVVRSFRRDRDRVDIELDALRPEACNPCFVALVQAGAALQQVGRFVVTVEGREEAVLDLPSTVLAVNWPVFLEAVERFPRALPQSTFVPCIAWARLAVESVGDAATASAFLLLNDAQHAINDYEDGNIDGRRLVQRLRVAGAAGAATISLLPDGQHLDALRSVVRVIDGTADGLADGAAGVTADLLVSRIRRRLDRFETRPAVLPTLDRTPLAEADDPHATS